MRARMCVRVYEAKFQYIYNKIFFTVNVMSSQFTYLSNVSCDDIERSIHTHTIAESLSFRLYKKESNSFCL